MRKHKAISVSQIKTLEEADAHQRKHGFKPLLQQAVDETLVKLKVKKPRKLRAKLPEMNKTEREFSFMLEAQKRRDEIARWDFHGMTLQWGGMRYTPDFTVFLPFKFSLRFIETKGAYMRGDSLIKFKAARANWPQCEFEMWEKAHGQWNRLL